MFIELNATAYKPKNVNGALSRFFGRLHLCKDDYFGWGSKIYTAYHIGPALRLLVVIVGRS